MSENGKLDRRRPLTENQVRRALGLDEIELHLVAATLRVGRYDPLTHLLVFSRDEVERLARHLGRPLPQLEEDEGIGSDRVPEPSGE